MIGNCLVTLKCVGLVASVTVTLIVAGPATVGVPVMAPQEESINNPAGSPVAVHTNGVAPPVAATGPLYATPTKPFGSEAVVITRAASIVTENGLVTLKCVGLVASVTVTLIVAGPATVGVPVMAPLEESINNPAGSPVAVHTNGVAPPVAATGPLYARPTTPFGSADVVIVSTEFMMIGNCLVTLKCVGLVASVTVTLIVAGPATVGVPVMAPLEESINNPAGSPVAVHTNGVAPPVAATAAL